MTTRALLLVLLAAVLAGCATSSDDRVRVRDLDWLAGSWQGSTQDREPELQIVQDWSAPKDGQMRGQHRGYLDGELVLLATLRIVGSVDRVSLIGSTDGEPSRIYRLVEHGPQRLVFSSDHRSDFPARGEFARDGDRLTVRFLGDDGTGGEREVVYELRAAR